MRAARPDRNGRQAQGHPGGEVLPASASWIRAAGTQCRPGSLSPGRRNGRWSRVGPGALQVQSQRAFNRLTSPVGASTKGSSSCSKIPTSRPPAPCPGRPRRCGDGHWRGRQRRPGPAANGLRSPHPTTSNRGHVGVRRRLVVMSVMSGTTSSPTTPNTMIARAWRRSSAPSETPRHGKPSASMEEQPKGEPFERSPWTASAAAHHQRHEAAAAEALNRSGVHRPLPAPGRGA